MENQKQGLRSLFEGMKSMGYYKDCPTYEDYLLRQKVKEKSIEENNESAITHNVESVKVEVQKVLFRDTLEGQNQKDFDFMFGTKKDEEKF